MSNHSIAETAVLVTLGGMAAVLKTRKLLLYTKKNLKPF